MMPRFLFVAAFLLCVFAANARGHHQPPPLKSDTVFINGLVQTPAQLTTHDLRGIPMQALEPVNLINAKGDVKRTIGAAKGLLLRDILQKAGVDIPHKEGGKYFVVITAMDGLQVIFAYNELLHGAAADHAYLLLLDAGSTAADDGPFAVICTSDVATVARYVKWVRSIEVRKI